MQKHTPLRLIAGSTLLATATAASAHTGHAVEGMLSGLVHPLGMDHLLAMVAVGVWSVFALPPRKAWMGPAVFMLALVLAALLGASGVTVPGMEHAIAASVVLFGVMLAWVTRPVHPALGLSLVAAAASLHGLAHGAEAPLAASFASYAIGFLFTTAALHISGVLGGMALRQWAALQTRPVLCTLGAAVGLAGSWLFAQA